MFDVWGISTVVLAMLAVCLNVLLINIILFYARSALGKYKWALIVLSLFEITFALGLVISPPYFVVTNRQWNSFSWGTIYHNGMISTIGFVIYCSLHQTYVMFLAFLFVYRYLVICHEDILDKIKKSKCLTFLVLMIQPTQMAVTFVCGAYLCSHETLTIDSPIRNMTSAQLPASGTVFSLSIKDTFSTLGYANHIFVYYCTVPVFVYCGISIWRTISKQQKMISSSNDGLVEQKRLFYLVLIQTLTPLTLSNLPFLAVLTFPLWSDDVVFNSSSELFPLITTIPKIVDPIAIIFFIPHYRRALGKLLHLDCCRSPTRIVSITSTRYMFDFCGILTVLVASSAVFLNLLLIVIILFYARTALGKYKYALIALSLFEIIFALGLIFALPYFLVANKIWYSISWGTFYHSELVSNIAFIIYCSLHQTYVIFLAILFVYRYLVICHEQLLYRIKNSKPLLFMCLAIQPAHMVFTFVCGFFLCTREVLTIDSPLRNLTIIVLPSTGMVGSLRLKDAVTVAGYINHVMVYYGTIPVFAFCGIAIWRKIYQQQKSLSSISDAFTEQKQLFYLIIVQTFTPLTLINLPFLAILSFPLWPAGAVFNSSPELLPLISAIPKIVDPLATIFFIPHYRRESISPSSYPPPPTKMTYGILPDCEGVQCYEQGAIVCLIVVVLAIAAFFIKMFCFCEPPDMEVDPQLPESSFEVNYVMKVPPKSWTMGATVHPVKNTPVQGQT